MKRIRLLLTTVVVVAMAVFAHVESAAAQLTVLYDRAFIDNRPTVATAGYDDPALTGLNLNLAVTVTDAVGGFPAVSAGTATFVSSNPGYNLSTTMFFDATRLRFDATPTPPGGLTPSDFPNIRGTFTFTVTDANGTVTDTSHNLDTLEVLSFPTNIQPSNNSTTPVVTFTDPNPAPPPGITRAYELRILDAGTLQTVFGFPAQLTTSFVVPCGILVVGHSYDFRVHIIDADTAEIPAFFAGGIHDPTESRSVGWFFNFKPQFVIAVSNLTLAPATATNPVGTTHTVTATATDTSGAPVPGAAVTFTVTGGPNAGETETDSTNANGQATFTYSDTGGAGTDTIQAHICSLQSNSVQKTWQSLSQKCPLTQGFWKSHPSAWPVTSLTLGTQTYTRTELLVILSTAVGSGQNADASLILADQVIAARLNIAHGSDPAPISATIATANALLSGFSGKLPYHVQSSSVTGQAMVNAATVLNNYNNGLLTSSCIP